MVLNANLNELEKLGLERSTKFKNINIYSFNKTKSNEILIEKAMKNNFKLMKRLMEPPFGNWIHEPLGSFFLNKFLIPIAPNSLFSYKDMGNFITTLCLLTFLPIFVYLIIGLNNRNYRRLACCLFQIRNILDYMDGNLVRLSQTKEKALGGQRNFGRLFDEYGSRFPSIALLIGSYVFIFYELNVEQKDLKKLNCFFSNMYQLIHWLKNKLGLANKNFNTTTINNVLLKEIYFKMILFIVCIILAGILWNSVYDSNTIFYGDYLHIDGVCFLSFFKILY